MPDSHLVTFAERLREARGVPPVSTNNDQTTDTELLDLADEAHPLKKRHCDWFIPAVLGFLLCPWTGICAVYYAIRGNCTTDFEKDEETVKRHNRRAKYLTFISIVLGLIAIGSCITILLLIWHSVLATRANLSNEMDEHLWQKPPVVFSHDWVASNENTNEMQQTEWKSQDNDGENTNVYYDRDSDGDDKDSESSEYSSDEDESKVKSMQQDRREDVNSAPAYYAEDDMNANYKDTTYNGYYEDYYGDDTSMDNENVDKNPLNNEYSNDYENTYDTSSEDQSQYYDEYQPDLSDQYYQYNSPSESNPNVAYDDQQTKDEWPTYENDANEHNETDNYYNENDGYYNADMPAGSYLAYYDNKEDGIRTTEEPGVANYDDGEDMLLTLENPDSSSNEDDYPYYQVKPSDNDNDEADNSERTISVNNDIYMGKDKNAIPTEKPVHEFYQYPLKTQENQNQGYYDSQEDEHVSEQYPFYEYGGEEYPSESSSISDTPKPGNYNDTDMAYPPFQQADAAKYNGTEMTDQTFKQDDNYDNIYDHDLPDYEDSVDADTNDSSNNKEFTLANQKNESGNISAEDMSDNSFYDDQVSPALYESEDVSSEDEGTYDQDYRPITLSSEEEEEVYLKNEEDNYKSKQQTNPAMYEDWTPKPPFDYRVYTAGTTKRGTTKQPLWKRFGYKK